MSASFFTLLFHFCQEALRFLLAFWHRVVSSVYLRLLIFLPAILIPACASPRLAFHIMYSAYKLKKQGGVDPAQDHSAGSGRLLGPKPFPLPQGLNQCGGWGHKLSPPAIATQTTHLQASLGKRQAAPSCLLWIPINQSPAGVFNSQPSHHSWSHLWCSHGRRPWFSKGDKESRLLGQCQISSKVFLSGALRSLEHWTQFGVH